MDLHSFTQNFEWVSDGKVDSWRILKEPSNDGKYKGDCDDFAITVAWIMSDNSTFKMIKNIFNGDLQFWWCYLRQSEDEIPNINHVALFVKNGVRNLGWIDNTKPTLSFSGQKFTHIKKVSLTRILYKLLKGVIIKS